MTKDIDQFDAPFIALSLELRSPLLTGDKKLAKGLKEKSIDWVLDTEKVRQLWDSEEKK